MPNSEEKSKIKWFGSNQTSQYDSILQQLELDCEWKLHFFKQPNWLWAIALAHWHTALEICNVRTRKRGKTTQKWNQQFYLNFMKKRAFDELKAQSIKLLQTRRGKFHSRRTFLLCFNNVTIHQRSWKLCQVFRMNLFYIYLGRFPMWIDCIRTSIRASRHFIIESLELFCYGRQRKNMDEITAEIRFDGCEVIQYKYIQ